jgi:8-oxo-dGTP diphosphatase
MEKRDLYDKNRVLTDRVFYKGDNVPDGYYFMTVVVWIENSKGELLIQKRTESKNGMYGTTGGHPKSGESSCEGLLTEIKEELGLDLSDYDFELITTMKSHRRFLDIYYVKADIDIKECILQDDEVESVKWMNGEEIHKLIDDNKFMSSHVSMYEEYLKYKNRK